jgi:aldoxime dehydratase
MESAIPEHLDQQRKLPKRMPPGFRPPYPSWVGRYPQLVDQVVMAYFGVQSHSADRAPSHRTLEHRLAGANAPLHWEQARYTDAKQCDTIVIIAYWDNPATFNLWRRDSGFETWWQSAERLDESCGYFLEVVTPTIDRFETLRSSKCHPEGIARLEENASGEIEEHAYWGSTRDRLPVSQIDALACPAHSPLEAQAAGASTIGKRVVLPGHDNLCLIRSGQDWSATSGQERTLYLTNIQPTLADGMQFLQQDGASIGCLSCRYMTVLDDHGHATEKTFGLVHFDSLANLEQWARTHPTHLAIFGGFQEYVQKLNFNVELRLYHEVSVVSADGQYFEYINCHPDTGLLR